MSHSRKLICSLLITLAVIFLFSLLTTNYSLLTTKKPAVLSDQNKKTLPPVSQSVDVVARVGGYLLSSLSGWTSAYAEVTLTSWGLARKTTADNRGYFIFYSVPVFDNPGELCLTADDVHQLSSFPICLAPPPRNQNLQIQDVLLSPTISIETGKIPYGKTTKASGMAFPNSEVKVYLFTEKNLSFWARISQQIPLFSLLTSHFSPSIAHAANFPIYETKSNENGYFEFSLPASFPSQNRIFVSAVFAAKDNSPKSNTLYFQVLGILGLFNLFLQKFFEQIKALLPSKNDPLLIVLIEILILIGLAAAIMAKRVMKSKESA